MTLTMAMTALLCRCPLPPPSHTHTHTVLSSLLFSPSDLLLCRVLRNCKEKGWGEGERLTHTYTAVLPPPLSMSSSFSFPSARSSSQAVPARAKKGKTDAVHAGHRHTGKGECPPQAVLCFLRFFQRCAALQRHLSKTVDQQITWVDPIYGYGTLPTLFLKTQQQRMGEGLYDVLVVRAERQRRSGAVARQQKLYGRRRPPAPEDRPPSLSSSLDAPPSPAAKVDEEERLVVAVAADEQEQAVSPTASTPIAEAAAAALNRDGNSHHPQPQPKLSERSPSPISLSPDGSLAGSSLSSPSGTAFKARPPQGQRPPSSATFPLPDPPEHAVDCPLWVQHQKQLEKARRAQFKQDMLEELREEDRLA